VLNKFDVRVPHSLQVIIPFSELDKENESANGVPVTMPLTLQPRPGKKVTQFLRSRRNCSACFEPLWSSFAEASVWFCCACRTTSRAKSLRALCSTRRSACISPFGFVLSLAFRVRGIAAAGGEDWWLSSGCFPVQVPVQAGESAPRGKKRCALFALGLPFLPLCHAEALLLVALQALHTAKYRQKQKAALGKVSSIEQHVAWLERCLACASLLSCSGDDASGCAGRCGDHSEDAVSRAAGHIGGPGSPTPDATALPTCRRGFVVSTLLMS
jgi:hypothetical protein